MADLGEGPGGPPHPRPLILGEKIRNDRRKAGWVSIIEPGPLLSSKSGSALHKPKKDSTFRRIAGGLDRLTQSTHTNTFYRHASVAEPQTHKFLKILNVILFLSNNRTLVIVVQTYFIAFKTEETSGWNIISVLTLNCITIKSAYICLRHQFKQ